MIFVPLASSLKLRAIPRSLGVGAIVVNLMSSSSKIEWTDATWNPTRGCAIVSSGCANCYAMKQAHRQSGEGGAYEGLTRQTKHGPIWTGEVRLVPELLDLPVRWKKPKRIFVNSMSDLFHESVPDYFIVQVFQTMAAAPQHIFQILTKRPKRMHDLLVAFRWRDDEIGGDPLPNVHLGVSCEDQKTADERIPLLLQTPAAIRWVSAEPLLGPINLDSAVGSNSQFPTPNSRPDWLVVGGESGPGARPMHPAWARSLRDQCVAAAVPYFFKQWGAWLPLDQLANDDVNSSGEDSSHVHLWPGSRFPGIAKNGDCVRIGKRAAGRHLDGREWNEMPDICPIRPISPISMEVSHA